MNRGRVGEQIGGKETDRCPLTIITEPSGRFKEYSGCSRMSQSSVWMWLQSKYKGVSKPRTRAMEGSYIYGYVSFGLVLLLLLGLIGFTWMALRKIRGRPVL
jgi:hypothetical protein